MASTSRRHAASRRENQTQPESVADTESGSDDKVVAIINYVLRHSAGKVPIKSNDLLPLVGGNSGELKTCIPVVAKLLAEHYGIIFRALPDAAKKFICYTEAPPASIYELTEQQRSTCVLLQIVLTYIFMRGNLVEDDKLYRLLHSMDIDVYESHAYFGDNLKKLIDETFVRQQYLKRERDESNPHEDPKTKFSWGSRALCEFTYEQIVQFVSKVLKQDPENFTHQLKMAQAGANPDLKRNSKQTSETSSVDLTQDYISDSEL